MCFLSCFFGYRLIDFYSGCSPGEVCGGKQVKYFCAAHSIFIMSYCPQNICDVHILHAFASYKLIKSIHRLMDDFKLRLSQNTCF